MSDTIDDFDDLVFDEAALGQIDEIETAAAPLKPSRFVNMNPRDNGKVPERPSAGVRVEGGGNPFLKPQERTNTTFQIRKPGPGGSKTNPAYKSPLPNTKRNGLARPTVPTLSPMSNHRPVAGPSRLPASSSGAPVILGKSQSSAIDLDGPIDLCSDDLYGDDGLDSLPVESLNAIDEMVNKSSTGRYVQSELGFRAVQRSPRAGPVVGGSGPGGRNGNAQPGPVSLAPISSTTAYQTHLSFQPLGRKKKGKTWDRTQFASTGIRGMNKDRGGKSGKKKKRTVLSFVAGAANEGEDDDEESEEEEEEVEGFDQFPLPFIDPSKCKRREMHMIGADSKALRLILTCRQVSIDHLVDDNATCADLVRSHIDHHQRGNILRFLSMLRPTSTQPTCPSAITSSRSSPVVSSTIRW